MRNILRRTISLPSKTWTFSLPALATSCAWRASSAGDRTLRRFVGQVAREVDGLADAQPEINLGLGLARGPAGEDEGHLRERLLRLALAGHVLGEAVGAERQPLGDRAQLPFHAGRQDEGERLGLLGVRGAGRAACERARVGRAHPERVALAETDDEHRARRDPTE